MPSLIAQQDQLVTRAQRGSGTLEVDQPAVAFEVLADGRILTASGQAEAMTGMPAQQLRGLEVEGLLAPEERSRFAQLVVTAATCSSGVAGFTLVHGADRVPCEVSWWATDRAPGEGRLRAFFTSAR